jgi:hypothetical protein
VELGVEELRALARKYRALVGLRAQRDGGGKDDGGRSGGPHVTVRLRELAGEFPGCLRELDTLGAVELARRARVVEEAASGGGAREAWMAWIWDYHQLMRAALALRRGERADDVDPTFATEVTSPPEGRVGIVVFRRLASLHARPAKEIAAALFPVRRPSPYEL